MFEVICGKNAGQQKSRNYGLSALPRTLYLQINTSPQQLRNFYRKMLMEITPFTTVNLWGLVHPNTETMLEIIEKRMIELR